MFAAATALVVAGLLARCTSGAPQRTRAEGGTAQRERDTIVAAAATVDQRAAQAIAALQRRDMRSLAALVHPTRGVRFTPYAHVSLERDLVFRPEQVARLADDTTAYLWGTFDGSGEPIRLSYSAYRRRFVYDRDYANAPQIVRDARIIGRGNTPNNIAATYPGAAIVEYHFPGVDQKYGGMDWTSLWLVLERVGDAWYLAGIVHGAWTI